MSPSPNNPQTELLRFCVNSTVLVRTSCRQRKEIALLDLEQSSHSEFGSVELRYRDLVD